MDVLTGWAHNHGLNLERFPMRFFKGTHYPILEVQTFKRPVQDQHPRLSEADLADLYALDPFRRCHACKAEGFIWLPPFTERGKAIHFPLMTILNGRPVLPRAVCWRCLPDDIEHELSGEPLPQGPKVFRHPPQGAAANFPFPEPPYKVRSGDLGEVWLDHRIPDAYKEPPILTKDQVAHLYASEPALGMVGGREGFLWMPPFSAHLADFLVSLRTVGPRGVLASPEPCRVFSSGAFRGFGHRAEWF